MTGKVKQKAEKSEQVKPKNEQKIKRTGNQERIKKKREWIQNEIRSRTSEE